MKKIYILFCVAILAVSCKDTSNELPQDYPDSGWVEIGDDRLDVKAPFQSLIVNVPIQLGVGNNSKGQVITYEVKQTKGETVKGLKTGVFKYKFNSGDKSAGMPVEIIDAPNYELSVTLLSTNNPEYTIGLSDNSKRISFKIGVCGSIPIASGYDAQSYIDVNVISNFTLDPVLVAGTNNKYEISTAWGADFVANAANNSLFKKLFIYPAFITINDDFTITVEGNPNDPSNVFGANYALGGTGTFDICTNSITYELKQGLFTNDFTVPVTAKLP